MSSALRAPRRRAMVLSREPRNRQDHYYQGCCADAMLQRFSHDLGEYGVLATMNLNGDYISDALAAQVGGIGIAPGANINYDTE